MVAENSMRWLFLTLLFLASCEKEVTTESVRPVKTIQVSETFSIENKISFPGTLRAFQHADLSFASTGLLSCGMFTLDIEHTKMKL